MRNVDVGEVFYQHKNKVVNSVILILALLLAHNIYQQQLRTADSLRQRKEVEQKKNAVLEDIRLLERKIKGYKDFVNRKDISVSMNIMSEIAQQFSINVISIRPDRELEDPLYTRHFFALKLETDNYHNLGKFISRLESRRELYSVEKLKILPKYSFDMTRKWLNVDLTVSTILLKE
jgi:hypothetical protein